MINPRRRDYRGESSIKEHSKKYYRLNVNGMLALAFFSITWCLKTVDFFDSLFLLLINKKTDFFCEIPEKNYETISLFIHSSNTRGSCSGLGNSAYWLWPKIPGR